VGDRVLFGYDSSDLDDDDRAILNSQSKFLNQNPSLKVTIQGHCDERGTREYNLALGDKRASSVKDYLISLGINSERISVVSYGKERPQVLGSNKAAWSMNRRSVTTID
jgi:peptidoglycan-associated lipoprotein